MLNLHKHSTQVESRHKNSESGGIPILQRVGQTYEADEYEYEYTSAEVY